MNWRSNWRKKKASKNIDRCLFCFWWLFFLLRTENNWLNVVHYSLSTRSGTLVFAYETKIIVLTNKWDTRTRQFKYSITWSNELERYDDITSVLCLPFASDGDEVNNFVGTWIYKSDSIEFSRLITYSVQFFFLGGSYQNFSGILVGFSTGKCQLMTNRGKVIISQQWLPEPVQSIQLPNGKKTIEEIYVMYPSSICILQTKQLMQSMRSFEKLGEIATFFWLIQSFFYWFF